MKLDTHDLENVEIPDLRRLKALSDRLHLSPKRESVLQWQDDIKELQSEGIYPSPVKANGLKVNGNGCDSLPLSKRGARRRLDLSDSKTVSNDISNPSSKVNNTFAPEVLITPAEESSEPLFETRLRYSARKEYFRQRSSDECKAKIKKYALRMDSEAGNTDKDNDSEDKPSTRERYRRIGMALERIRTDLLNMRIQDNTLARQLLDKRRKLLQVKAEKTCEEHENMLEDFSFELELEEELAEHLRSSDLPSTFLRGPNSLLLSTSPLRHIGITRMMLDSKRFSVI